MASTSSPAPSWVAEQKSNSDFQDAGSDRRRKDDANGNTSKDSGSSNPRSILKRRQQFKRAVKNKELSVRFDMSSVDSKENKEEMQMHKKAVQSLRTLLLMWGKQSVKSSKPHPKYKNRLIVNFQPGMTPRYLKYLLTSYQDLGDVEDMASTIEQEKQALTMFVKGFLDRINRIWIVDNSSLNDSTSKLNNTMPSIIMLVVEDLRNEDAYSKLGQFIKQRIAGPHSLIVFSKPICGLDYRTIEKQLNVKVRQLWLPRLEHRKYNGTDYDFSLEYINKCYGIPKVMEIHERSHKSSNAINATTIEQMALWNLPEFKPYLGYFYSLFSFARSSIQLYTRSKLSAKLNTLDAAAVLGFDIISLGDQRDFDLNQKQISSSQLNQGSAQGNSFGRQWPFFCGTFVADIKAKLQLQPQVIPRVLSTGSPLNKVTLLAWEKGNREAPPQGTMDHNGWAQLMPSLDINRPIIPVEMSRSPDIMFLLQQSTTNILCFLVKTGVQNLSLPYFQAEVAKSPFLSIRPSGEIVRVNDDLGYKITFIYIAPVHSVIKKVLLKEAFVYEKGQETQANAAVVTLYDEFIHVKSGSKILSLPPDVEVIILLKRGLEALFGTADYHSLLDANCDLKYLGEDEISLKNKKEELTKTEADVREQTRKLIELVKHVPGADRIIKEMVDLEFSDRQ